MDQDLDLTGAACPLSYKVPPDPQSSSEDDGGPGFGRALSRRNFLKMGVGALGTLALLEIGGAGFMFLRSRSLEGEFGGIIKVGSIDEFPPGSVSEFVESQFFLVRGPDSGFLAIHNRCTHLGCIVNWVAEEDRFVCPCHAAVFDFYGSDEGPPVPRPLDTFPVRFDEATVLVDTSQSQRRDGFSPDQLVYAPPQVPPEEVSRRPDDVAQPLEG
jgi:cytochrome b6-f complex iron-sulfur subunit